MTELAWPYAHADLDPSTQNGLKCGLDENGDTILWSYPTSDIAGFTVTTKATAASVAVGAPNFGSLGVSDAGDGYFDGTSIFTAPIPGMYAYTVSALSTASSAFLIYFRMQSTYAAWGNPQQKSSATADTTLGGAPILTGILPCDAGDTLTFDMFCTYASPQNFTDIYMAFYWQSPLPV